MKLQRIQGAATPAKTESTSTGAARSVPEELEPTVPANAFSASVPASQASLYATVAHEAVATVAGAGLFLTELPKPTHVGAKWVAPVLGELRLNLGGEGEVAGFINVNPLMGNKRDVASMLARDPSGAVQESGAEALPYPDRSVREIRANALPSPVIGRQGKEIAAEILRVLVPGGIAHLHSNTMFALDITAHLVSLGFEMIAPNMAHYTKPPDAR